LWLDTVHVNVRGGKKRRLLEVRTNYCKGNGKGPTTTTTTAARTNIKEEDKYREILDKNHESEDRY
jgi:hypothetical protein